MKKSVFTRLSYLLSSLIALSTLSAYSQTPNHLVISQMYGAGGNSGATYNADFVEIFNPTSGSLSTSGLSVQYASAGGAPSSSFALPNVTIVPGHYFLVQLSTPTGIGAALPTPDATAAPAISAAASAGKIFLANITSLLSADNTCPIILADARIIDFVGYGTTATCFEGTSFAPAPDATHSDVRGAYSGNNNTDFTLLSPPNPRNSSSGGAVGALSATGSANPAAVTAGNPVTLTVIVTPATSPASTGITVVGDLRLIGGSQTQAFTINGDGTYSATATVTTTAQGAISLPITVTDAQAHTASASISLTVNQPTATVAIDVIQGRKSKSSVVLSPYAGQQVTTNGIVTAVIPAAFFIQTPDSAKDGDPLTPEGIQVFYGTGKVPTNVVVGANVTVTGLVATFPALSTPTVAGSSTPATEISGPTTTVNGVGSPLPAPITLTPADLTPGGGLFQLTPYEGMRVAFSSLTTTSGTAGSLTEASETIASDGTFYTVIGSTPRPFREPGIDLRDPTVPGRPANVAVFDDNPERIYVDSDIAGGSAIELSTGTVLNNVTGVLDFTFTTDSFYDPSRLILDATYDRSQVTPGLTVQPVAPKAANEFTVASYNIERFFNTLASDDIYKTSTGATATPDHPDLTQAAYTRRLQKVSLAVRNVLNSPDVVTIEEVENQSVANDIANQINSDAGTPGLYTGISTDNSTYFTQDGTGISVGFLVKNTVDNLGFSQFGAGETFTPTGASSPITLNDRPWLVLNAGIKRAGATDYPVTVIVNHMKSLINVNSPTSTSTRQKKELQAEDITRYIQSLQAAGKHVISGGDFNAFEFSDGYTDTLATYTNVNVLPADQVVQPGVAGLVTPPLVDLALTLPQPERWSYQEDGSAQILDHMVVTQDLASAGAHLAYAHMNADFPESSYNNATVPDRNSDHDAAVGYFILPAPISSATLTPTSANFGTNTVGVASTGQVFTITNTGETAISFTSVTATGDYAASVNCNTTLAVGSTCSINVTLTPITTGTRTGTLIVAMSNATYTSSLSGQGVAAIKAATTTSLATSPASPVNSGTVVTLTATVTAGAPVAAGKVNFYDTMTSSSLIGSAELTSAGTATFTFTPGAGSHSFQAQFPGTTSVLPSNSQQSSFVVTPTSTYLTSSLLTFTTSGSSYSLTDTVTFAGLSVPGGQVHFNDSTASTDTVGTLASLTPTMALPTILNTGATSTSSLVSAIGDFNKDGIPDLAITNLGDNTVRVLLGNGGATPSYKAPVAYTTGRAPYGVVVGDFNNDGKADLAVSNLVSGTVSILLGIGDGTFQAQQSYNTGSTGTPGAMTFPEPYGLTIADFNKDGFQDLVTTNMTEGTISILLGNGDGSFAAPTSTPVGKDAFLSVVADFNGDGNPDLMVVNSFPNNVFYLRGDGSGSFNHSAAITYATGGTPYSAVVGDFNQDGLPDVAISNLGDPNAPPTTGSVTILLNQAGGGFATTTYATGIEPTSIAVVDFNGDGLQDLAVTNYGSNTIGVLTGKGDGTFNAQVTFPSVSAPYQLSIGDLNGDGKPDFAVTSFASVSLGIQLGTQTGVYTLSGLTEDAISHQVSATYMPSTPDAYLPTTSNAVQVPAMAVLAKKVPVTRRGAIK
ncbi:FG-GAP-like repeat-containing protein [Granulicella arctica]|uniref:FG-GAP-like repeat-containing protein n=1 Tax=Granulicella arctica TaxID=940613 RepID=UPI0021E080B8|nr:FG-GAP-like repeat-containing protein [Granulicella arctica]